MRLRTLGRSARLPRARRQSAGALRSPSARKAATAWLCSQGSARLRRAARLRARPARLRRAGQALEKPLRLRSLLPRSAAAARPARRVRLRRARQLRRALPRLLGMTRPAALADGGERAAVGGAGVVGAGAAAPARQHPATRRTCGRHRRARLGRSHTAWRASTAAASPPSPTLVETGPDWRPWAWGLLPNIGMEFFLAWRGSS